MNDTELDELLDRWNTPSPQATLRARVRDARRGLGVRGWGLGLCSPSARWRPLRSLGWVVAIAGVSAFLIVVTQALPQTIKLVSPAVRPPFTVDCEYAGYEEDGSRVVEMYSTSYMGQNGAEVILGRTVPDHPFETALGRTLDSILPLWSRLMVSRRDWERAHAAHDAHPAVGVIARCGDGMCLTLEHYYFPKAESGPGAPCAAGTAVGHDTILGYATVAVERPIPNPRSTGKTLMKREGKLELPIPNPRPLQARITMWMAPDLGCFALRTATEEQGADGVFRPASEKRALRVNLNP